MDLTVIKGVNEKRKEEFNKMGIYSTKDLVGFFPRAYLDLREKQLLKYAYHNDVVLTPAVVTLIPSVRYTGRYKTVKAVCEQEGLIFQIIWFNQPYVLNKLSLGEEYLFYGRVQKKNGEISMINPTFEPFEKNYRLKGIVPQYQSKGSLGQKLLRESAKLAVNIEKPTSIIPFDLQKKYSLCDLFWAYREVHNPSDFKSLELASDRIAVEEYFSLISAFKLVKGDRNHVRENRYSCTAEEIKKFAKDGFPFEFTDGQKNAVNEIYKDMTGDTVMNRIVQGDVGSGKTAVSLCAAYVAVKSGYQVAFLAPTEVLARQNYFVVKNTFKDCNVELLTGSMSAKEKRTVKVGVSSGMTDILVGTHAIIQDDVEFKNLALCVCDEQQRFGVAQRSKLEGKGSFPDVMVMSATPIPRTLSLIFYGDLDITTIKDKPKSRIPVQTNIVPSHKYYDMLYFIEKEIQKGGQAYFVCPKIDGDEESSVISVTELYDEIKSALPTVSVGLLHGKMKETEKTAVMRDFKDKKISLLVSTTVIEVGVDVPDATVMVIYNAERFGLSTLHQLRGRVGRSDKKSYCFLMTTAKDGAPLERLKVVKDNIDGFKISEYDYKTRGGGDFLGSRQSGRFMKELGNLSYGMDSVFLAKKLTDEVFDRGEIPLELRKIALEKYERILCQALSSSTEPR